MKPEASPDIERPPLRYADFAVHIRPGPAGTLHSRVVNAPYGGRETSFEVPTLDGRTKEAPRQDAPRDFHPLAGPLPPEPRRIGAHLYEALFQGGVRDAYLRSLAWLDSQPEIGLRLRLVLATDGPAARQLLTLPWELLYREENREFIALNRRSPVVRHLDVPHRRFSPEPRETLRILVVMASPRNAPPVSVGAEYDALRKLESSDGVKVHPLHRATADSLRRALVTRDFDVVHFVGHGTFNHRTGEGALVLETAGGDAAPLEADVLAALLATQPRIRLCVLNACQTAASDDDERHDPLAGVAASLLASGLPAAVAMRQSIHDRDAVVFATELYRALVRGEPLDAAVTEGRLAVFCAGGADSDWAVPALYLSVPDGRIFQPAADEVDEGDENMGQDRTVNTGKLANSGTITVGSGTFATGDVIHNAEPRPEEVAESAYRQARGALAHGDYSTAATRLAASLAAADVDADQRFHAALARLARQRPNTLRRDEIQRIESLLTTGTSDRTSAHSLLLLALVRYDYYERNGLRMPPPSPAELVSTASELPVDTDRLREIIDHLPKLGDNPVYGLLLRLTS